MANGPAHDTKRRDALAAIAAHDTGIMESDTMRFSQSRQPRYAVYVVRGADHILVARFGSLARALEVVREQLELGETVYHDVN